jgi:hypothetical protein
MYFSSTSLPYLFHFPYPCLFFIFLILFSHHASICFSVYFFYLCVFHFVYFYILKYLLYLFTLTITSYFLIFFIPF